MKHLKKFGLLEKEEISEFDPFEMGEIGIPILKEMKIDIKTIKYISHGANGSVYKSPELPGKIIKFQKMQNHTAVSFMRDYKKIMNRNPKHVVKIFDLGFIIPKIDLSKKNNKFSFFNEPDGYFVLIREELDSIWRKYGNYSDISNIILGMGDFFEFNDYNNKLLDDLSPEKLLNWMIEHHNGLRAVTFKNLISLDIKKLYNDLGSSFQIIEDVFSGIKECRDLGITACDLFIKNVMYDPKEKIYKLLEIR